MSDLYAGGCSRADYGTTLPTIAELNILILARHAP